MKLSQLFIYVAGTDGSKVVPHRRAAVTTRRDSVVTPRHEAIKV
jgi:hypothetical protein